MRARSEQQVLALPGGGDGEAKRDDDSPLGMLN